MLVESLTENSVCGCYQQGKVESLPVTVSLNILHQQLTACTFTLVSVQIVSVWMVAYKKKAPRVHHSFALNDCHTRGMHKGSAQRCKQGTRGGCFFSLGAYLPHTFWKADGTRKYVLACARANKTVDGHENSCMAMKIHASLCNGECLSSVWLWGCAWQKCWAFSWRLFKWAWLN